MVRVRAGAAAAAVLTLLSGGCATSGGRFDPISQPATLVPDTKTGVVLEDLPPPVQSLDVAIYSFPDLTGQNKPNDNFAEFSRALTQGGAAILTDVLTKAGGGRWFNVVERTDLQALLQERQIIQNTRAALLGGKAQGLPPLRFAGITLEGGVIGYDSDETSGGIGANYLGIGGNTQYRQDVVTVALRAVSVQTGRVLASVTTTKTLYSVLVQGSAFRFAAVDQILQIEGGFTKNSPATLAVREGIQLAVYALIFDGVKNGLWQFQNVAAGNAFMRELDRQRQAATFKLSGPGAVSAADQVPPGTRVATSGTPNRLEVATPVVAPATVSSLPAPAAPRAQAAASVIQDDKVASASSSSPDRRAAAPPTDSPRLLPPPSPSARQS